MPETLTAAAVKEYQGKLESIKPLTAIAYKSLGREFRDKYGLTDREAINLLNARNEIEILAKYEVALEAVTNG